MIRFASESPPESVLCLGCLTTELPNKSTGDFVCPSCGYQISTEAYTKTYRLAEEAFQLGYVYRKTYEEQERKEGRVSKLYALTPPEGWMIWTTLAILGGIAGNFVYDLMKAAVMGIYHKFSSSLRSSELPLVQPQEFELMVEYIREYSVGTSTASEGVTSAIAHEWLADWTSDNMPPIKTDGTLEEMMDAMRPVILASMKAMRERKLICEQELPPIGTHYKQTEQTRADGTPSGSDSKHCPPAA